MPPANQVEAVCLHNTQEWPSGRWVPMRFELDSWVTLNPDPDSDWGRDSCRYHRDSQQYLWKAQVKGFELGCDGVLISRVKVRHAYEPRQLSLDPDLARPRIPCNCEYYPMLSNCCCDSTHIATTFISLLVVYYRLHA